MKSFRQLGKGTMRTKCKCSLFTLFLLCALCFFASLLVATFFSRDVDELELRRMMIQEPVYTEKDHKPIRHGETGEAFVESIPFQVLSWKPRAVHFPKFATAEMCEHIIQMARDKLHPSALALRKGETAESAKGIRTSSGTFVKASDDKAGILEVIERKIARATMIPRNYGESFNILRYERLQKYDSHYDAFSPTEYGPQKSQRIASFLLYLSDVDAGGDTMFPYEDSMNMNSGYDYKKCIGLKVKPCQGDGLLFYSVFPNGTLDKTSLHGSCPVVEGEKWVATKWIRDEVQEGSH